MKYKFVIIFLVILVSVSIYQAPAFAHRSGCHRWHSCPSDTGSYTCGDTGYCSECSDNQYCKAGSPITHATITYTNPTPSATTIPSTTQSTPSTTITSSPPVLQNTGKSASQVTCHAINGISPDPKCTPGAIDPKVTQSNIKSTICTSGYTKTVRPSTSVTDKIKVERMKAYGYTGSLSNYELDHLIPLELGGNPSSVKNLWPEPWYGNNSAKEKDKFENYLHTQVCSGKMSLGTAQFEITSDWIKYWSKTGNH